MAKIYLALGLLAISLVCCVKPSPPNRFSDPDFIRIANYQDRRLTDSLLLFFNNPDPRKRSAAALAFASVQDSLATVPLGFLLKDDSSVDVRVAAAYALGQTAGLASTEALVTALDDRDSKVIREIYEAIGKTATGSFVADLRTARATDSLMEEGLAWGYYRLALRNRADTTIARREAMFLNKGHTLRTRLGAAHFFNQAGALIGPFEKEVIQTSLRDESAEVRMAAAAALRKIKDDNALIAIGQILDTEKDYRVRINATRSLQSFTLDKIKEHLLKALDDAHPTVAIAASEIAQTVIKSPDSSILREARNAAIVRVRTNLYKALLATQPRDRVLSEEVKKGYQSATSVYDKTHWISAVAASDLEHEFIYNELMRADSAAVRTAAALALTEINRHKDFEPRLRRTFADYYKNALGLGDPAVIAIVTETIADPVLDYNQTFTDISFLREARNKLHLPKDIESLQPLDAAIAFFEGRPAPAPPKNEYNHPIDWTVTSAIPKNQKVEVMTTKGKVVLRLLIEDAPGSVTNFVTLARQGYFNGKFYHRVVPNFVVQTGCNRGDGFGSEDYSIRSEFGLRRYKTGSVGMASAGKDTEGTQWFITHSPTPHLDGRYTIFAEVIEGFDVVDQIQVGDRNITVSVIESKRKQ